MSYSIAKEFKTSSLLKFTMPTVIMMIFTSLYTVVDGIFVARFVGSDALSSINIVLPVTNIAVGIGIMLGTGGSAIVAKKMGEGKSKEACENFSLILLFGLIFSALIALLGLLNIHSLVRLLGASDKLIPYCVGYLRILLIFMPVQVIQLIFASFFVTSGKPILGLVLTVAAGLTNAILDYVFIVPMQMGIEGAAWATIIGYFIPAVAGIILFFQKKSDLRFLKPKMVPSVLVSSCGNGSSEMVSNLASSLITYLFNIIMMRYYGEEGVAAVTIVLYAQFLFSALYLGFSSGIAPVISYNYGGENWEQLKRIYKICMKFILASSVAIVVLSILLASPIVNVFSPKGTITYDLTIRGFILFSVNYLFAGTNIFASSLFTALSNGKVSAIISFLRTFVFIALGLMLLPQFIGIDGVWLAVPTAELLSLIFSLGFIVSKRKVYHYA